MTSLHSCKSCVCQICEKKQPALRRGGPDRNAVSASSITPDTIHGKSLLVDLILAFANVPCSHFTLSEPRAGLTTSLAVCSPFPKASFLELLFLHQTFSLLLHTSLPTEEPLTESSRAHFSQCRFFSSFFCFFSGYIFKAEKREEAIFAALHCKCQ